MRSQVEELLEGARQGRWILPSSDEPNPVSLARAIASVNGAPATIADPVADRLHELIGEPEHLVFVIADGFGMNFVNTLDESSFSRSHLVLESRAVFPTSTGSNLFAFGRAQWPGQHGELGWYVHLPELGERATLFPWVRTRDGTSLSTLGLSGETVFPGDPMLSRYQRDSLVFAPDFIAGTIPTLALHGDSVTGYADLADAVDLVVQRIDTASEPTYTHIYWPNIDSTAHGNGSTHRKTLAQVRLLDSEMQRLANLVSSRTRIIVTADHGHADTDKDRRFRVDPSDPLSQMLTTEPAGEGRLLYFRVREGRAEEFAAQFLERFGSDFFLFTTDGLLELGLLGPDGLSDSTASRLGDFMAISKGAQIMEFCAEGDERMLLLKSTHGGMLPDETLVPLIIA